VGFAAPAQPAFASNQNHTGQQARGWNEVLIPAQLNIGPPLPGDWRSL